MVRTPCCDKARVKRGPWSKEEDAALQRYICTHGTAGNWIALPRNAGINRCGKSCRLRWLNYLRPGIRHGNFTEEEDGLICSLYKDIGSKWSVIASYLPGRTDNDVKNRWNTKLKKRTIEGNNITTASPPPNPSFIPTVQTGDFSLNPGFAINQVVQPSLFSELPPLSITINQPNYSSNISGFGVPPSQNFLAASSSATTEDDINGYMNWSAGETEPGLEFGPFIEFRNKYSKNG